MARVCTLKDWLEAFYLKQEDDLQFFEDLLAYPRISKDVSQEIRRRLDERRQFSSFFKSISWHDLSLEDLQWCEKKMEEILLREDHIKEVLDRLVEVFRRPVTKEG